MSQPSTRSATFLCSLFPFPCGFNPTTARTSTSYSLPRPSSTSSPVTTLDAASMSYNSNNSRISPSLDGSRLRRQLRLPQQTLHRLASQSPFPFPPKSRVFGVCSLLWISPKPHNTQATTATTRSHPNRPPPHTVAAAHAAAFRCSLFPFPYGFSPTAARTSASPSPPCPSSTSSPVTTSNAASMPNNRNNGRPSPSLNGSQLRHQPRLPQ